MIIHCKHCHKQLTKSLFPTKWRQYVVGLCEDWEGNTTHIQYRRTLPVGGFTITKKGQYRSLYAWDDKIKAYLHIDRQSLLLPVPKYEQEGVGGCCDVDGADIKCTCGVVLGNMSYDCWQITHSVALDMKLVYHTFNPVKTLAGGETLRGRGYTHIIFDELGRE